MSSYKMKSLLKGLRYISQVFENAKEEKIEIGNPTDVKHVAHIGLDGPSDNTATAPSWMNEFKSSGGFESGQGGGEDDSSVRCRSECGGRSKDLPNLPKSTRKSASPTKERPSDKTKRRSSNKVTSSSSRPSHSSSSTGLGEMPKKSRRKKKTKDGEGSSSRSTRRSDADNMSDFMSETGSVRSMPQFDSRDDF